MSSTTAGKLRSACDTCHRTKVRCSGDLPCEGCSILGTSCYYSYAAPLGRPRGTKNRRSTDHDETSSRNVPEAGREAGRRPAPRQQPQFSPSAQHMNGTFAMSDALNNPGMVNIMMDDILTNGQLNYVDTQQQRDVYHPQTFDFSNFLSPAADAQGGLGPSSKNPFDIFHVSLNDVPPSSSSVSSYTSPRPETRESDLTLNSPTLKRDGEYIERSSTLAAKDFVAACSCFQENAEMLCLFKLPGHNGNQHPQSLDAVLLSVREVLKPWRSLIECRNCAYNSDQEVLLLVVMTIRVILLRLQQLLPPWSFQASAGRAVQGDKQSQQGADSTWPNYNVSVVFGAFEPVGNDKLLVLQVLLLNTIRKVKSAMGCFKEMLDRKKRILEPTSAGPMQGTQPGCTTMGEEGHAASNLQHVQQMLHSQGMFLQTLEKALERKELEPYMAVGMNQLSPFQH